MGGPLSVILSDICMTKIENSLVVPRNPSFYYRYVDDIITRRRRDKPDELFKTLNKHKKLHFTCEVQPTKFLDTDMIKLPDNSFETTVHRKTTKLPAHWTSKAPYRRKYKRNAITSDLSRASKISSHFETEKTIITNKFTRADCPKPFIRSVIKRFEDKQRLPPQTNQAEPLEASKDKVTIQCRE
ncbi:uncharacterized protein [Clytia hemisphaerica]|uniref:uncharacterized protein n=1 Tax=Clytia hemisphaerica TaxID=252671 RepID=UPI0034D60A97